MTPLRSRVKLYPMKKLSLYIFLVLMFCNVGFAETYICSDDVSTSNTVEEATIWERYSEVNFVIKTPDGTKLNYDKIYEDQNVIVLFRVKPNSEGKIGTLILNKNDLTYGGSQMLYPFADSKNKQILHSGKCKRVN